jgi:PIF1-like helicase
LLRGGCTSHSRFKIPLSVHEQSTCAIPKNSDLGHLISHTELIIWDEVPMQHRRCAEAFDQTARDLCSNPNQTFGGITVVFGGDFRQILPVIPKGTSEQIISACLKHSHLWQNIHKLQLTQNMRLRGDPAAEQFSKWLLEIGEGAHITENHSALVDFPVEMLVPSRDALIDTLYPNISQPGQASDDYLRSRTILAGRNEDVLLLNNRILDSFPGEVVTYSSADSVGFEEGVDQAETNNLSNEYLQSLNCTSLPLSQLKLKVGCPVMILRNIAAADGLCNGTRAVITHLGCRVLEVHILGGSDAGKSSHELNPWVGICLDDSRQKGFHTLNYT